MTDRRRTLWTFAITSLALFMTALDNLVAQRAYGKAGFRKVGEILDMDVRGGERVRSWLMIRDLPS